MRIERRKIPQVNSGASADIAFLLLIFFLIVSSLEPKTGIYRRLSPEQAEDILKKQTDLEKRNFLELNLNEKNELIYQNEVIDIKELKDLCQTFIDNPNNVDYLPKKEIKNIPEIGDYPVSSSHVISLNINSQTHFQAYLSVLDEITKAYNNLQNEAAVQIFGKAFSQLTLEQKIAIRKIYPFRLSEKAINNEEGGTQ